MDQSLNKKFKVGTLALALVVLMSACSSSRVEDKDASAESVADIGGEANTDEVPNIDPAIDGPVAGDPALDGAPGSVASSGDEPPMSDPSLAGGGMDPNMSVADAPPMGDPNVVDPGIATAPAPAGDALAASGSSLDLPSDENLAMEPAPMSETGERDYLGSTTNNSDTYNADQPSVGKKKKKHGKKSAGVARTSRVSGDGVHYSVKRGDTLMKIAFENYGDLYRWREIYEANRSVIQDPNNVPPGTQLTLNGAGMVQVERNGEQYMIHRGETLGTISKNVYGSARKWKKLWENNRQLIKDPNKIYAGFYLYYQPEGKLTNGTDPAAVEGEASRNSMKQTAPVANNPANQAGQLPRSPASTRQ